ncbi:hypothetical protein M4578_08260 [Salipiger sp. P9]|uniref:hypothetical protein n=1 Tax=Salipiger pentaromativorans TaxID=2943193 RepID=UPI0021585A82|nr:hypothetical protein [Salipiger pentaromativorans]MCR8547817.1 hypothetical protein [Salipiger pentaromativorans]
MPSESIVDIPVPLELQEFVPAAILRLKYMFPEIKIERVPNGVTLHGIEDVDARKFEREISYQIYREKIFQETLTMRQNLYQMLVM